MWTRPSFVTPAELMRMDAIGDGCEIVFSCKSSVRPSTHWAENSLANLSAQQRHELMSALHSFSSYRIQQGYPCHRWTARAQIEPADAGISCCGSKSGELKCHKLESYFLLRGGDTLNSN